MKMMMKMMMKNIARCIFKILYIYILYMLGFNKNKQDQDEAEKREIIKRALDAPVDISYLQAGKTKYKFQLPTLCLIFGMSQTGKTSYILSLFMDDPHPDKKKALIYVNNSLFPLDKIVVEYAKKNKNVFIITSETFDIELSKYIIEIVKGYNTNPKNPIYTYLIIDNMVFDINPNALKVFIGSRHYTILTFVLVHVLSSVQATSLSTLRDLSTHYIMFKWFDTEKLKKLLSDKNIDDFIKKINENPNKYSKMIFDKYAQINHIE